MLCLALFSYDFRLILRLCSLAFLHVFDFFRDRIEPQQARNMLQLRVQEGGRQAGEG